MSDGFETARIDDLPYEYNDRAGANNINLVERLGCEEMRPRIWKLSPGEEMSYHHHTAQEEFYFLVDGPGGIVIDDEFHEVEEGTAIRIAPELPRQLVNRGDRDSRWLVVGAPALIHDGEHI